MQGIQQADAMDEILQKANKILTDCNEYMAVRIAQEQNNNLTGIQQVERIFELEAEFFVNRHSDYVRLREYEDTLFFEADQEEYYRKHLICVQQSRQFLTEAIRRGIEDGTIRKGLEPKQEAAVLEGAFGSVLRNECEKIENEPFNDRQKLQKLLKDCVRMSMKNLSND